MPKPSVEDIVNAVAVAMRKQLRENTGKTGWWQLSVRECFRRAEGEFMELRDTLQSYPASGAIEAEVGDIANYLGMLLCNAERRPTDRLEMASITADLESLVLDLYSSRIERQKLNSLLQRVRRLKAELA
jgi:hypothetical protein